MMPCAVLGLELWGIQQTVHLSRTFTQTMIMGSHQASMY